MAHYVTSNYGLKGGTLDATRHVEAAIPRLLNATERHQAELQLALLTDRKRRQAGSN